MRPGDARDVPARVLSGGQYPGAGTTEGPVVPARGGLLDSASRHDGGAVSVR